MEDVDCDLEFALSWTVAAKNSLKNIKPTCFWGNQNFPVALNTKLLALERKISCEAVEKNNNAMHTARQNFIQSESGDRFR